MQKLGLTGAIICYELYRWQLTHIPAKAKLNEWMDFWQLTSLRLVFGRYLVPLDDVRFNDIATGSALT